MASLHEEDVLFIHCAVNHISVASFVFLQFCRSSNQAAKLGSSNSRRALLMLPTNFLVCARPIGRFCRVRRGPIAGTVSVHCHIQFHCPNCSAALDECCHSSDDCVTWQRTTRKPHAILQSQQGFLKYGKHQIFLLEKARPTCSV